MNNLSSFESRAGKFTVVMTIVAALSACGGSDPVAKVAGANTTVAASAATAATATTAFVVAAGVSDPVTFSNGFAGLDSNGVPVSVSGVTTVAFGGGTATSPGFSMTNNGMTATGTTTFGSCTFTFSTSSPFSSNHPWGPGKTLKVDPCSLTIPTAGANADGSSATKTITLTFGSVSGTVSKVVSVAADGSVSIGGTPVGTVTVSNITGAGG